MISIVFKANQRRRKSVRPRVSRKFGRHAEATAVVRTVVQIVDQRHENNQSTFVRVATDIQQNRYRTVESDVSVRSTRTDIRVKLNRVNDIISTKKKKKHKSTVEIKITGKTNVLVSFVKTVAGRVRFRLCLKKVFVDDIIRSILFDRLRTVSMNPLNFQRDTVETVAATISLAEKKKTVLPPLLVQEGPETLVQYFDKYSIVLSFFDFFQTTLNRSIDFVFFVSMIYSGFVREKKRPRKI